MRAVSAVIAAPWQSGRVADPDCGWVRSAHRDLERRWVRRCGSALARSLNVSCPELWPARVHEARREFERLVRERP